MTFKNKQIKLDLKKLRDSRNLVSPAEQWVKTNRGLLMSKIKSDVVGVQVRKTTISYVWDGLSMIMPPKLVQSVVRPMFVLLLAFSVASGGWITAASAAHNSLPGRPMHFVKTSLESAQLAMARLSGSSQTVTVLEAERVVKRLEEARTLSRLPAPKEDKEKKQRVKNIQLAAVSAKKGMEKVNEGLEKAKEKNPAKAVSIVKAVATEVENVEVALNKVKGEIQDAVDEVGDTTVLSDEDSDVLNGLKRSILDAQTKVVDVIVEKHAEDAEIVTDAEVKKHIDDQIEKIEGDINDSTLLARKEAKKVKGVQDEMDSEDAESSLSAEESTDAGSVSSGESEEGVAKAVEEIVKKTTQASDSVKVASDKVKEKLDEAGVLLKTNDFSKAAEKLAQAREQASDVAQKANDVADAADTVESGLAPDVEIDNALPVLENLLATSSLFVDEGDLDNLNVSKDNEEGDEADSSKSSKEGEARKKEASKNAAQVAVGQN